MNNLCITSNLTSSELASWVQAIGSVLAIFASALIAIFQSKKQYQNAQALYKDEQRHIRIELAKTLAILSRNSAKAIKHSIEQMPDRESIHKIASGENYLDVGELRIIDNAIAAIPLHSLPDTLVSPTMILGATIRQFREKVEGMIAFHRTMDENNFEDMFRTFQNMLQSLDLTCGDIEAQVEKISNA